jgi:hypothetical protein
VTSGLSRWTNWALDGIISSAVKTHLVKPPVIQSYRFGQMVVDGKAHARDLILLPERLVANWWRKDGHRLDIDDLQEVLSATPDVLVVGTGAYGLMKVPQETRQAIEDAGIRLRVARTGEAWQIYNDMCEGCPTAGAFHLTC